MNFALILFLLLVATGLAWVAERLWFAPARARRAAAEVERFDRDHGLGAAQGLGASQGLGTSQGLGAPRGLGAAAPGYGASAGLGGAPAGLGGALAGAGAGPTRPMLSAEAQAALAAERSALRSRLERQPLWLEYTAGLFPVIAAVFFLRSFVAEPFKIPSGSMIPTLLVGDLILVNKFAYGIRLPVANVKVLELGSPQRGDVMVFRFPRDESYDYIKRVVGVPGDRVVYENKRLTINGEPVPLEPAGEFYDSERLAYAKQYVERLGGREHRILTDLDKASFISDVDRFPFRDQCTYSAAGVACTVPPGHYFVMGDNRENSLDSRYWGFVPDRNIVGKAFFVWMNFGDFKRIGPFH